MFRGQGVQIHALLLLGNGRRRLERCPEGQGHPVGDAAQNAAAVIGGGPNRAVFHHKGVIIFAATEPARPRSPTPNSMPFTAGMPKTMAAMRFSMPSNTAVRPARRADPARQHSTMPPTESPSALAAAMALPAWSPLRRRLTTGNGLSAVETVRGRRHPPPPPMAAMRLMTSMPCLSSNCRQMPPGDAQGGCQPPGEVRRPRRSPA